MLVYVFASNTSKLIFMECVYVYIDLLLFRITDATVYLLERTGDLAGALKIMLNLLTDKAEKMLASYLCCSLFSPPSLSL